MDSDPAQPKGVRVHAHTHTPFSDTTVTQPNFQKWMEILFVGYCSSAHVAALQILSYNLADW